jgi:hypothetical protein
LLSKHIGIIDCARKAIKLTSESGEELEYVADSHITCKGASNCIVLNQLDASPTQDVRLICDFSDVFPEDLSSMAPDLKIKFVIELVPDIAPIFNRPL